MTRLKIKKKLDSIYAKLFVLATQIWSSLSAYSMVSAEERKEKSAPCGVCATATNSVF